MRHLLLGSLFLTGCLDYERLSSGINAAPDLGEVSADLGDADLADPVSSDLAGLDLNGLDLAQTNDMMPADMACTTHTHSNGVGGSWTDCVAIGTYNAAQAMKACTASYPAANCIAPPTNASCANAAIAYNGNWTYFVFVGAFKGKVIKPGGDCTLAMNGTADWN